jgi:hypothetical protein
MPTAVTKTNFANHFGFKIIESTIVTVDNIGSKYCRIHGSGIDIHGLQTNDFIQDIPLDKIEFIHSEKPYQ